MVTIWRENVPGYLSADIICSEKGTDFRERSKYLSIFSPQMKAIVFIILQIFFVTRVIFKIGEYINNSRHLARKYARIFVHGHYLFREADSFAHPFCALFMASFWHALVHAHIENVTGHSRPQRPSSFWSAPRIATSDQVQTTENSRTSRHSAHAQSQL